MRSSLTVTLVRSTCALILAFLLCTASFGQARRFYLAPDDHTDYFWNADEAGYRQAFLSMLDYYLDKMDQTQANPSDQQMRWNTDGSLWMWEYEHNRSSAQFTRFIDRVRDRHLSVPLNALVLVQGGAPAETVLRGMYYPGLIERRYNLRFPIAVAMEDQTMPYGISSLWSGAGAKYSWKGVCNCATEVPQLNDRDREIYYAGGRDGSSVLLKWQSQYTTNTMFGSYIEAYDPIATMSFSENSATFQAKYPYPVIGAFGRGGDDLQYMSDEFVTVAQQNTTQNRRIVVSDQIDFFQDFEANHGSELETFAASFGNDWDTLVASMAEVSARVKRATEKLRAAEAMATLVSVDQPSFMTSRIAERDRAMLDMGLYFEHDWTADGPITRSQRAAWSRQVEQRITAYVDKLSADAQTELSRKISRSGSNRRFVVFNPLGWSRTDFADIPVRLNRRVNVIDVTTGLEVPSQIIRAGNQKTLRILASDVPSAGYKVYEIRSGGPAVLTDAATVNGRTIENARYRLTVAPDGALTSLIDKSRGNRETVRTIDGKVINDLGGDRSGSVVVESNGPVSVTLRAVSASPLQHTTRVTLYRNIDRIEITNEIEQNFGDLQTWSFSFDLNSPDVRHEEVGAVIRAKLLPSGGHYSPRNARYDWLTMNHFADMTDGAANNFGVTISNWDDFFMRLGASGIASLDTSSPQIRVLAGGQTNGPGLGIPDQGGDQHFTQRFALQTHGAFDQAASMRMSLEHQNPFVSFMVDGVGVQTRAYPSNSYSFLRISDPSVLLWSLKPAEDGISRGIIARVWNQANAPLTYDLSLALPIVSADKVTHIETTEGPANVTNGVLRAPINQQQIQTHLLRIAAAR